MTSPVFRFGRIDCCNGISVKNLDQIGKSVDPDETARYEPSHQDRHCLHRYCLGLPG